MTEKIIDFIDEEADPPVIASLSRVSSRDALSLPLDRGVMDEKILGFLTERLALAVHDPTMIAKMQSLIASEKPFTGLVVTLGLVAAEDVDLALWNELDVILRERISVSAQALGLLPQAAPAAGS